MIAIREAAGARAHTAPPKTCEPLVVFVTGLYSPKGRDSVSIQNRDYMIGLHDLGMDVRVLDMTAQGDLSSLLKVARVAATYGAVRGHPRLGGAVAHALVRQEAWLRPLIGAARYLRRRGSAAPAPASRHSHGDGDRDLVAGMTLKCAHGARPIDAASVACVLSAYDLIYAPAWGGVWKRAIARRLRELLPRACAFQWFVNLVSETTQVSPAIVRGLEAFDEVWVPAEFHVQALARSGATCRRVFKVPEAVDTAIFHERVAPARIDGRRDFCFLTVSQYLPDQRAVSTARQSTRDLALLWNQARKATDLLIQAFLEEFGPDEDVCLAVKSTHDQAALSAALRRVVTERGFPESRLAQIVPIGGWSDAADVARLYAAADAFVLVSRGEGWGRPLAEAMALRKPTIGANFGGNTEFMTRDNSYLIDCETVPVASVIGPKFTTMGNWADPSLSHLRQTLRAVFTDRHSAGEKAARAAHDVRTNYSRLAVAEVIRHRIRAAFAEHASA